MSKYCVGLLIISLLIFYSKCEDEIKEVLPYENYHLKLNKENPIIALKFRLNNSNNDNADLIIHFQSATGFTVKGLILTNLDEVNSILSNTTNFSNKTNSIRFVVQRKDFIVKIKDLNLTKENEFLYIIFKDRHYFYEDYVSIYRENDEVKLQENQPYLLSRFFSLNYRICSFTVKEKNKYSFEINNFDKSLVTIYTNKSEYKEIFSSDDNLIGNIINLLPNKTYYIKITNMRKEKKPYYKSKFLILITKFDGFKPLQLQEGKLHFEKFITFNKYFYYFDITNYKINEENYITYRYDSLNKNINNEIKAVIVTSNDSNITDFKQLIPVKDSNSIFTLIESHKFKDNVYHLKFKKTIQKPKEKTLLLISIKFEPKDKEDTFIYPDDFEIGVGKRMDLKYLEEQNFKYNDQWITNTDNDNSMPHFYKYLLNDTKESNIYDSDNNKIEKSIIIQSFNGTKVKIQKSENSTLVKEKLNDNTVLLKMKKDNFLILKVEKDKKVNQTDNILSFKIFYTNHTIHNFIKPENLKLLNEKSPLLNDHCVNDSYLIINNKIKHFIPSFNIDLLLRKYYLTSVDNDEVISNTEQFLIEKYKENLSDDINLEKLNCKSIVIYNQVPIQVNSINNLLNEYSFTIKKDLLLSYDKFLLNLKQMDGNKQKEHYFEFNNTNLNNEMKEENTKLIGKNITEGIYRVEITGYGKKGSENFIEKYKPLNIQIRNIENEKNTFTLKYFIFFILILMITLLILFDTIKNNKLVIVHQRKYNYYTQLNDEEEEMMKL
jgi:hypothetical protein